MKIHDFNIHLINVIKDCLQPEWSWNSDVNGWTGFHLWYVFQNDVKVRTGDTEYSLSEGDTFLFDFTKSYICTHDPEKPASIFTAYFHCDQGEQLRQMLRSGAIRTQNHPRLYSTNLQLFEEAVRNSNTEQETDMWLTPIFHQLFSTADIPGDQRSKILEICNELNEHPQKDHSLESMASRAGYSKNQFIRVFKQVTGITPYAYLVNARITKGKHLLLFSDYTVTQVAQALGYHDLNHFSSQFYRKTGCYPSRYVQQYRRGVQSSMQD